MSDETEVPSLTDSNGRDMRGRFRAGNRFAVGNPLARKVNQLRAALSKSISRRDIREIAQQLVVAAKGGDIQASKLVLDRALGPPAQLDLLARIEALESAVNNGR